MKRKLERKSTMMVRRLFFLIITPIKHHLAPHRPEITAVTSGLILLIFNKEINHMNIINTKIITNFVLYFKT